MHQELLEARDSVGQGQLCAESDSWWSDREDGREKAEKTGGEGQKAGSCLAAWEDPF